MSTVLPASASASAGAALPGAPRRAWFDGFGMRHLAIVLLFTVSVPFTGALFKLIVHHSLEPAALLVDAIGGLAVSLCAILSAVVADNRLAGVLGPRARVAVAVLAASIAGAALTEALIFLVIKPLGLPIEDGDIASFASTAHRLAFQFTGAAVWSLMLVVLYSMFDTHRRATGELHAANVAAFAAERDLIESNLRAMQARVDPDLLFDTLLEVDRAYARGFREGEEALDALIAFLRAALPVDLSRASTVTRELELVGAFVAVLTLRPETRREVRISAEPSCGDLAMPAMLLLPLVRWALEPPASRRLQVAVRRGAGALEVVVRSEGAYGAQSQGHDIKGVDERLRHLYGERGRCRAAIDAHSRQAVLEIPL